MSMTATATLKYTPVEDIPKVREELQKVFMTGKTKDVEYRRQQIMKLGYMIQDHAEDFNAAFKADLRRPLLEASFMETAVCLGECAEAVSNIYKWAKTTKPPFNLSWTPMNPYIRREPKGVVLIIVPFNYPLFLTVLPLLGAMAAGCCTVVKLPEAAPHFSSLFEKLMAKCVDTDFVRVVQGAAPEVTKLLELRWDHIFYTGGSRVGRIVATAAAKHLTPVSIELGGKNPVFVDSTADLPLAARRILWGRCANSGQICLCPDYVLVQRDVQDSLVEEFVKVYKRFYPEGARRSDSFARLVSPTAWKRVKKYLDETKGTVVVGGGADEADLFIEPTVLKDVALDDITMGEEIFGPILSLVPVDSVEEALLIVNSLPSPLTLYIFSKDKTFKEKVLNNTRSGSVAINEVIIQNSVNDTPFHGIGQSGYGAHRGKFGFDTFTHERTVIDPPSWIDIFLAFRYPPYTPAKLAHSRRVAGTTLPFARPGEKPWVKNSLIIVMALLVGFKLHQHFPLITYFKRY